MKKNGASGETQSLLHKSLNSISTFFRNKASWLTAGSIMLFASLGYLFYFFSKKLKKQAQFKNLAGRSSSIASTLVDDIAQTSFLADNPEQEITKNEPVALQLSEETKEATHTENNPSFLTITWPEFDSYIKGITALTSSITYDSLIPKAKKIVSYISWPILAIVLVYLAQSILNITRGDGITLDWNWLKALPESSRLWLGSIIFIIAMVIWLFTSPIIPAAREKIAQIKNSTIIRTHYNPIRFSLLIASSLVYAISILSYIEFNEKAFIRVLWVIGLILFILSQVPWPGSTRNSHLNAEESPRFHWKNWIILAIILGAAFWLRFYQVGSIPDFFHGDNASYGIQARDFLLGNDPNIFDNTSMTIPKIGFLPTALSMLVFGNNIFGLQMTSVIGGFFSILALYLLVWRLFNNHRLAAITASLVAINLLHIHFSRTTTGNMDPWPFCLFALFFFIDGLKGRRPGSLGLAGIFIAFGINMYYSGRVTPVIMAGFLLITFFICRPWITENKSGLVLFALGFLVAMGPSLVVDITNWQTFVERSREVIIFNPANIKHLTNKYTVNSLFDIIVTQTRLTLLMFNYYTDMSSQFGFPHAMFNPVISPLLILGFGASIRRWKEPGIYLSLIWLGLMIVVGSILTIDSPFWPRMVGIVPVAALIIALAIDQILELGNSYFHKNIIILKTSLVVVLLVAVGWSSWIQYYAYVRANGAPMGDVGRYLSRFPTNITACGLFNGISLTVRETAFQVWPRKIIDIKPDGTDSDLTACSGSPLVWVISPENKGRLQAIRALWPDGIEQETTTQDQYVITYYLVGVPIPQTSVLRTVPAQNPTLKIIIFIYIGIAFAGALIFVVWKRKKIIRAFDISPRQKKNVPMPRFAINWSAIHPKQTFEQIIITMKETWGEFLVDLNNWYDELYKFDLSKYSGRQIASTAAILLLPLVVVGLAYYGQNILDQGKFGALMIPIDWVISLPENMRLEIAGGIFLIAAVLWGLFTTNRKKSLTQAIDEKSRTSSQVLTPTRSVALPETTPQRIRGLVKSAGYLCTFFAMFIYLVMGENGVIRWLWVIGLGLFLSSYLGKKETNQGHLNEESPSFRWYHVLILCSLLGLAFFLRVYRINDIPLELSTDMAGIGLIARNYLLGVEKLIFGIGWSYHPRLAFLPTVVSLKLFGENLIGLYSTAVVMGTLNILACYLFIWRLFDQHRLAIITTIILVISPAHINYSRIVTLMDPWCIGFFAFFFLIDGLKGRRKKSLAFAGILTGITLVLVPSGRVIIPIIGILLGCIWLFKRQWIIDNRHGFIEFGLGFLVFLGPNIIYMITNWSDYMSRAGEVIITNPGVIKHLENAYRVDSFWMIFWEQLKRSVFLFNYYTDLSPQSNYPHTMYNSLISPMLILGFGSAIFKWKKPEYLFTVSSFALILFAGGVLTVNAPTWARLVGIIPFSALLIAFAFNEFYNMLERVSWKVLAPFLSVFLILYFSLLGIVDWNLYLGAMKIARPVVLISRYIATLPTDVNACGMTNGYDLNYAEVKFLDWPRNIVVVPPETQKLTPAICPGTNIVWILSPDNEKRLPELQTVWPGGIVQKYVIYNGDPAFMSYLVTGETDP